MKGIATLLTACVLAIAVPDTAGAQDTANPHGALPAGMDCADCHTAERWLPLRSNARFDHDKTRFALAGKHSAATCNSCHDALRFKSSSSAPRSCASCHTDLHEGRFGRDCASCHDARSFKNAAGPQAHARSNLPLTGAHAAVPCEGCHRNERAGSFTALDTRCVSCHQRDYDAVKLPNHVAGNFPQNCMQCHAALSWRGAQFDHTGFALTGAHASASCTACHSGSGNALLYRAPTSAQDCVACHEADYDSEHRGSAFPTTCATCHRSTSTWDDAQFEHASAANGFALLGAHIRTTCGSCHVAGGGLRFSPKPSSPQECAVCHNPDYQREHSGSGYPDVCTACHTVETWGNATFRHDLPALECVACHRPDYDRAPNHAGYATTCRACHASTTSWLPATIAHERFPLTGAHTTLGCSACHVPPNNALIYPVPSGASDCVACHRADYDRQHTGSGFSTSCTGCHTNTTWSGATFDHAAVARGFALIGRHTQLPCSACHSPDGRPIFSPAGNNDCVSCHRPDYDRRHSGSSYPLTCTTCHTQNDWTSSYNHDAQFFPIFSGSHAGKWSTCQQCHTTPGNMRVFDCLSCHTRTSTDPDHREVSGYSYESNRCYSCHPRGKS